MKLTVVKRWNLGASESDLQASTSYKTTFIVKRDQILITINLPGCSASARVLASASSQDCTGNKQSILNQEL